MKIYSFSKVQVVVNSIERSRYFFEEFLGLNGNGLNPISYSINGINLNIDIREIKDATADPNQPGYHFRHIGFEVDSLEKLIDSAVAYGFSCFQMNEEDGSPIPIPNSQADLSKMPEEVIFIRDYDNNLWEFVERGRSLPMLFER